MFDTEGKISEGKISEGKISDCKISYEIFNEDRRRFRQRKAKFLVRAEDDFVNNAARDNYLVDDVARDDD